MPRLWIIVNPAAAGGRSGARWRRFAAVLRRRGIAFVARPTRHPGHATELARDAVRQGAERIAVVGGDGTLHDVVQALAGGTVPVAFLPSGSSCDAAKDLPPASFLERLASTRLVLRDLIRIDCTGLDGGPTGAWAVNGSHLGLVAEAARRLNASAVRGWSVDLAAVAAGVAAHRHSPPLDVRLGGADRPRSARLLNLAVLKSDRLVGGMRFGIPVSGDDGRLVAVAAAPAPLPGLLTALYRGRAGSHPAVSWWYGDSVRVEGPIGAPIEADGEIVGLTPATYTVVPRAVRLVV